LFSSGFAEVTGVRAWLQQRLAWMTAELDD